MYMQRIWCRPVQVLCMLPLFLWAHISFAHVNLEGLIFLVSSDPSGSYPELWGGRDLVMASHLGLSVSRSFTFCITSGCWSLYLLLSATGRNFSADGWARHCFPGQSINAIFKNKCTKKSWKDGGCRNLRDKDCWKFKASLDYIYSEFLAR